MQLNKKECEELGIDPKVVEGLTRALERLARSAEKEGIQIFGGAHSFSLRAINSPPHPTRGFVILAHGSEGSWDGGDGGSSIADDGLERGE